MPAPTGYSEQILNKYLLVLDTFVSHKYGCPDNWMHISQCKPETGYFDYGAFLKSRSLAMKLYDLKE